MMMLHPFRHLFSDTLEKAFFPGDPADESSQNAFSISQSRERVLYLSSAFL